MSRHEAITITLLLSTEALARMRKMPADEFAAFVSRLVEENIVEKKQGRPPKGEGRIGISLYIEAGYHAEISALAEASGLSKSDVVNAILARAYRAGMFAAPDTTDGK